MSICKYIMMKKETRSKYRFMHRFRLISLRTFDHLIGAVFVIFSVGIFILNVKKRHFFQQNRKSVKR